MQFKYIIIFTILLVYIFSLILNYLKINTSQRDIYDFIKSYVNPNQSVKIKVYPVQKFFIPTPEKKYLKYCENKVEYEHSLSIWTLLSGGVNYANSSVKLIKSIRKNIENHSYDAIVLEMKKKPLSPEIKKMVKKAGWKICTVNRISPRDTSKTYPRFYDQFTKLQIWKMQEFEAAYYFDSDTIVVGNLDSYLEVHKKFGDKYKIGAVKDFYAGQWLTGFNMGVFVIKPNKTEFSRLIKIKKDPYFFFRAHAAEQGFLNEVYRNYWYQIGFEYNGNSAVYSQNRNFWKNKSKELKVIHYTMEKPWSCSSRYKKICDIWRKL